MNQVEQDAKEAEKRLKAAKQAFKAEPTGMNGRRLFNARKAASDALVALYEAHPEKKPPDTEVAT